MDSPPRIAFIGLGAMGLGMATHLARMGFNVTGCDIDQSALDRLVQEGGKATGSAREAVNGASVVVLMVVSAAQIESILFSPETGAATSLQAGSTLMICATVSPEFPKRVQQRLAATGVHVVDCPVSGGVAKAADGCLKIFASADGDALDQSFSKSVLDAMAEKYQIIPGGLGSASKVKLVNQQLAGVHIAAAAEAMALATSLGLNLRQVYRNVLESDASSWMYENRVPHILDADLTPKSALNIFVKDMGIVVAESSRLACPVPLSCVAQQLYIAGSASGYGREDDSGLIRLYLGPGATTPASRESGESNDATKAATVLSALRAIHVVSAAEAFALCEKLDLDDELLYNSIGGAAGSSRVFETYGSSTIQDQTGTFEFDAIKQGLVSSRSQVDFRISGVFADRNQEEAIAAGTSLGLPMFLSTSSLQSLLLAKESPGEGAGVTASLQRAFISV